MIAAIEIADEAGGAGRARRIGQRAQELGLLIRPLGNIIYLWPPLNVSSADLEMMLALLDRATRETE